MTILIVIILFVPVVAFTSCRSNMRILMPNYAVDPLSDVFAVEANKPWQGNRDICIRKKQIPNEAYAPKDVIRTCLLALQNNDDPQLDHGMII
jgi:hypothetical protein